MAVLTASPLGPSSGLNWAYLVDLLIAGVLAIFFLFYFNRLFATLISYGIRAYTWHKYRAYIDITALQISLLGGRIFFKTVRYHAHNITVFVHDGHITWKYWYRLVRDAEIFNEKIKQHAQQERVKSPHANDEKSSVATSGEEKQDHDTEAGKKKDKDLPCRISINVSGVEAFIYNRSPSYDGIIEATMKRAQAAEGVYTSSNHHGSASEASTSPNTATFDEKTKHVDTNASSDTQTSTELPEIPSWLQLLPIRIICKKAAAAIGNENTTSVLTAKVDMATGVIDAAAAQPLDLYQLLFKFQFHKVTLAMKPNRDYKRSQTDLALQALREKAENKDIKKHKSSFMRGLSWRWHAFISRLTYRFKRKTKEDSSLKTGSVMSGSALSFSSAPKDLPGQAEWHGLRRYLSNERDDEHAEWKSVEYAKASNLADCEQVDMRFYWDIPGQVRSGAIEQQSLLENDNDDGDETSKPPQYGIDLTVHGGMITYGPWADRQRQNLQKIFFPAACVDAIPKPPPRKGETRLATVFKLFLLIEKDVTLRLPNRESSKDHRWRGRAGRGMHREPKTKQNQKKSRSGKGKKQSDPIKTSAGNADTRPYGWMDLMVKADSTVNYTMDMYARKGGFRNFIDVDVKGTEINTSVNHALLWRTGPLSVAGDLSNPLSWNSLRDWPFKITVDDLEMFILRDHLFLIIDLVNDWGSGAPPDFYTFIPFRYTIDLSFHNFIMYLNTNDANIINDPANFDRNDFLTLEAENLDAKLGIPLQHFRPKTNEITFDVLTHNLSMRMLSSPRNTIHTLLQEKRVAKLPKLTLIGSFNSNSEEIKGLTDTLRMDIEGEGFQFTAYGFLLRHLINVKENYFGDFVHFKTLEEFQDSGDSIVDSYENTASLPKPRPINELDVLLSIVVRDATIMFPTNLYSATEFVRAEVPEALVDLRTSSYYLDLAINLSPISIQLGVSNAEEHMSSASNTQLYVAHTNVYGHRAFGLPPNEPAYACTWDIDVGKISGELQQRFLHDAVLAAKSLIFTFMDKENALPLDSVQTIFDATFVQVRTDTLRVWVHVGDEALLLSTDPVTVHSHDWSSEQFSQQVNVLVPNLTVACVDRKVALRDRSDHKRRHIAKTYAFLQTSIALDVVGRKRHFTADARRQQAHIRRNDLRTGRTPFLVRSGPFWPTTDEADMPDDVDPPAMSFPPFPAPLSKDGQINHKPASLKSVLVDGARSVKSQKSLSSMMSSTTTTRPAALALDSYQSSHPPAASNPDRSQGSVDTNLPAENLRPVESDGRRSSMKVAFSSIYNEPNFALDNTDPDQSDVPAFVQIQDPLNASSSASTASVDPESLHTDEESAETSIMIRLEPGIRLYAQPEVAHVVANLLGLMQPKSVEDVLDDYQMDVMSRVTQKYARESIVGKLTQICVNIPTIHARVLNPTQDDERPDVVDIVVQSLDFMTRIREGSKEIALNSLSFHIALQSLMLNVCEGRQNSESSTAVQLAIMDVLFWLALSSVKNMRVIMTDFSLDANAWKAPYLTALAQRVMNMVPDMQSSFNNTSQTGEKRLHLLLYQLTQLGEHVDDPPFLTRMTYILRAFPHHFRNQDSWKILMRFRNIMLSVPTNIASELEQDFQNATVNCPDDAPKKILESWRQWRNWDVINIERTLAFKKILDEPDFDVHADDPPTAMCLTWIQERLRIGINDKQDESRFVIEDLEFGIEIQPPSKPTGLMLVEENTRTRIMSHIHANGIVIDLHWHLVNLVDTYLPQILKQLPAKPSDHQHRSASQALEDGLTRRDLNLVLSTDTGRVSLHAINVQHIAQAEGLRMSLIGTTQAVEPFGACASALINASRAETQLLASTTLIWQSVLTSPSMYIDNLHPSTNSDNPPSVNVAIAYNDLQLHVKEQLPGILHVVDAIIADEVKQVLDLVNNLPKELLQRSAQPKIPSEAKASPEKPVKIYVALLAGKLLVEMSLLQSLKYRLNGQAASLRLAPSLTEDNSMAVDFATGTLHHSFVNISHKEEHIQRIVDVPPINGHVNIETKPDERNISISSTIGRLDVEAEVLQALMTILNRSEVQNVITAIKDGVNDIQDQVAGLKINSSPQHNTPDTPTATVPLRYDVRVAFAGVKVAATTPPMSGRSSAEFQFGIGPCHAVAANAKAASMDGNGNPLFPEIRASMREIGTKLTIIGRKHVYPAGNIDLGLDLKLTMDVGENGKLNRDLEVTSQKLEINAYPETAAIIIDVINQLQDRLKDIDLSREVEYIKSLRERKVPKPVPEQKNDESTASTMPAISAADLLAMKVKVSLTGLQVTWLVHDHYAATSESQTEDLVLTWALVELTTHGGREGRLTMKDLQLQLVPHGKSKTERTINSALMPEIAFSLAYWSQEKDRHLAFKASGKPFDLRLDSKFIVPFNGVQRSIDYAVEKFRAGTANWQSIPTSSGLPRTNIMGSNHFKSLVAEADFAGAQFYLRGAPAMPEGSPNQKNPGAQHGRYGQFTTQDGTMQTTLRSPGVAFKLEYDNTKTQPSIQGEMMVAPSNNLLLPNVVPLILDISKSVREVMQKGDKEDSAKEAVKKEEAVKARQTSLLDESLVAADPSTFFGKTKVNLGFRIAKQEFGMTCEPIARIDAKAKLDDFYFTMSTIESNEHGHFFAISASLTKLSAEVKHVYSREPTFSFEMDSVVLSLMNNKHFSGTNGISAILKIDPTRTSINGKQLQDLLLFREIWLPPEIRHAALAAQSPDTPQQDVLMHKYQSVSSAAAFPWNATVSIAQLAVDLDLGSSLGKTCFKINDLWASSEKTSSWEQNLCIGLGEMEMVSQGRMSGFIDLSKLAIRTMIKWPKEGDSIRKTPRIQASVGFGRMRAKAAFDYQAFAFGDIEGFDFLMYNVDDRRRQGDRLVATLDCAKAYVHCTSTSAAQAFALYQAVDRLIQEKQAAFGQSLRDIEKYSRRESTILPTKFGPKVEHAVAGSIPQRSSTDAPPITLHVDVVVSLGNVSVGAFPGTFFDGQILKVEANNMQANFAVGLERGKVSSGLGMTIGQLQVALASVKKIPMPKSVVDIGVEEVIANATEAKGGIIARVPRVIASMQTWQSPGSNTIEYTFKSLLEGKVDIGWNLNRINLIRGMWTTHTRALAARLGRSLPESAVKITGVPDGKDEDSKDKKSKSAQQQKITAEVNLPQSRYEYVALEPPIIETPQLRDMGEATPPLEWVGLHRDRLPNVTHQIVIVSLLEVAKEAQDAYERILGTSST